jgi:hypothetical protein
MRIIFSSMAAASLLFHAALGCCWHHEHDNAAIGDSSLAIAVEAAHDHDHGDAPADHNSNGPCKGHSRCHGSCNYLRVPKTQVDTQLSPIPFDFVAVDSLAGQSQTGNLFRVEQAFAEFSEPPLRLHLLHQLILV